MKKRRGSSLGAILMICTVATMAAFTVAASSTFHLQTAVRIENQQIALDLADSAIQQAAAELMHNTSYGNVTSTRIDVPRVAGMPEDAKGWVTFDPNNAEHDAYSTNNQGGNHPDGWDNRAVPLSTCMVVGIGRAGGQTRRVEVLLHVPKFPRSIASDGKVQMKNSLIAAINSTEDVSWDASGNLIMPPEDKLARGDLLSNLDVTMTLHSRVTGSVQAKDSVTLDAASRVDGEVMAPAQKSPLPGLNVTQYDPKDNKNVAYDHPPSGILSGTQTIYGTTRYKDGPVRINGDLILDNGIVYVQGNLTITGSLKGVGAVFVNGETAVGGGVRLTATDNVAIVSEGRVSLRGDGKEKSAFQGLVYTRGDFSAAEITIIGSFISEANELGVAGNTYLDDCNVLFSSLPSDPHVFHQVSFVVPRFGPTAGLPTTSGTDASGFFIGNATLPGGTNNGALRNVQNVLGQVPFNVENWSSHWEYAECAVVKIFKEGGQFHYTYGIWGRTTGNPDDAIWQSPGVPGIGWSPDMTDATAFADAVRLQESDGGQLDDFLSGASANLDTLRNNLLATVTAATTPIVDSGGSKNMEVSPNKFLNEGDATRILYRREL